MKRLQLRALPVAALVLLVSAACADQPIAAPEAPEAPLSARAAQPSQPQPYWTSDDEYARVSRAEVPGFAGWYLEDDGTPVILLKDHRQREAAERYLAPQLAMARRGRNGGPPRQPVIRKVTHDFATLKSWADGIAGLPRPDIYVIDVDEVGNGVHVGVRDDAAIQAVRREAARLRIPPGALRVQVRRRPELRETLRDRTAVLMGGYQIQGPSSTLICSFGFNATYQGIPIFVTASHCTQAIFTQGSTFITQPTYVAGNEIGNEYADRGMYACAGTGTLCRKSDAAYIRHNGSRTIGRGKIAYTSLGSGGQGGLEVLGSYDIIRRYAGTAPVGTWLDKTGRTTGSTFGQVVESCVTIPSGGYQLRCQDVSTVYSDGGDSGSPMYVWLGNNQVELYGILWGGPEFTPDTTYSSRLGGIEQDLGALTGLCAPGWSC